MLLSESCPTVTPSVITAALGDTVKISCWVNYNGSIAPQLQWTPGGVTSDHSNGNRSIYTVVNESSVNILPAMTPVQSYNCSVTFTTPVSPRCPPRQSTIHVSCMYFSSACYACSAQYCFTNYVRPSVRPSVCLSVCLSVPPIVLVLF